MEGIESRRRPWLAILIFLGGFILGFVVRSSPDVLVPILFRMWWPVDREEIARTSSPDGALDAVMIRTDPGAVSSYGYEVHIVPKGTKPREGSHYAIFSAKHMEHEKLVWKQSHLLEIQYEKAHIFYFCNLWYDRKFQNAEYFVELRLAPRSVGFSYLTPQGTLF